ncbi:MAG: hypothetical protein IID39_00360 [Planctomycetes bacterium]|nr:hypothetical protein [Planctomycetota bacterium]
MLLANLTNRGATPALLNTLAFTQARHKMIAENVANWHTPGYKTKQLDPKAFQQALRRALDAKGSDPNKPFVVRNTRQFGTAKGGYLRVTPSEKPVDNVLFHDRTNASIERMMTNLADNAMVHEAAITLLKGNFDGLRKAIRGRM